MNPQLLLENIRNVLVRLEETIMFGMIERAQFKQNTIIYDSSSFKAVGEECLVDYLLHETEKIHARVRRYKSPDEHPFHDDLPEPILPALNYNENPLHHADLNINSEIRKCYEKEIIPLLCKPGDDQQHGSSAVADVSCLQSLSKRIHYGMFVAESKYRQSAATYNQLITAQDREAIRENITNEDVEKQVLERLHRKASTYLQELNGYKSDQSVKPESLVKIYRDFVIPMTKQVEVEYLMRRQEK